MHVVRVHMAYYRYSSGTAHSTPAVLYSYRDTKKVADVVPEFVTATSEKLQLKKKNGTESST